MDLSLQCLEVVSGVGAIRGLNQQGAGMLQAATDLFYCAIDGLEQGKAVVGIAVGLIKAIDLCSEP